jgi:hypothetical protein
LLPSALPPQPLLTTQTFVQSHRLQLVHDSGACLHHPVPVPQQLPQIAILPTRHPDSRKTVVQQQLQNQLSIVPVRLLLAHPFGSNLGGISDPADATSPCCLRDLPDDSFADEPLSIDEKQELLAWKRF